MLLLCTSTGQFLSLTSSAMKLFIPHVLLKNYSYPKIVCTCRSSRKLSTFILDKITILACFCSMFSLFSRPLPFFSLFSPLLCLSLHLPVTSVPLRRSRQMAIFTESGSAQGFCLVKKSFSSPLSPTAYSVWSFALRPRETFSDNTVMNWHFK